MQPMAASLKDLIDPPASIDGETGSPSTAGCRVIDAIAGDCSSSFGERLKIVEAECGFGKRCSRGCAGLPPADCSFIGAGRCSIGRMALSPATVASGNAQCFDAAGSAGGSASGAAGSGQPRTAPLSASSQAVCASAVAARPVSVSPIPCKV
jgi:hypothetical protein